MNKNLMHIIIIFMLFNFTLSDSKCSTCFTEYYKQVSCSNIPLQEEGKKCVYSNGECKEITCDESNQSECENDIHYDPNCFD